MCEVDISIILKSEMNLKVNFILGLAMITRVNTKTVHESFRAKHHPEEPGPVLNTNHLLVKVKMTYFILVHTDLPATPSPDYWKTCRIEIREPASVLRHEIG